MNKPRYIEAHYTQVLRYDLEDLDIDWNELRSNKRRASIKDKLNNIRG